MRVQKRGTRGYEQVHFDKVTQRLKRLSDGLNVNYIQIAQRTIKSIYDGIPTERLDMISAKIAESEKIINTDYSVLASRILISNLHKSTDSTFSAAMTRAKESVGRISDKHYAFIMEHAAALDALIDDKADYAFDYFGYSTIANAYLIKDIRPVYDGNGLKVYVDSENREYGIDSTHPREFVTVNGRRIFVNEKTKEIIIDRPQYMFMRVAVAIYINYGIEAIAKCYGELSQGLYIHATPTLFNACAPVQQLGSCFLLGTEDSIEDIMNNAKDSSLISKCAGGIGIHMHNIRPNGSLIRSTRGHSAGLPRQLKIYNDLALCWNQGGKRPGAIAIYLEPWHGDIMEVLKMRLHGGADESRTRDLFYGMWIPDLFMKCAMSEDLEDQMFALFNPDVAKGLHEVFDGMIVCKTCNYCANPSYADYFGSSWDTSMNHIHEWILVDAFTDLYDRYVEEGLAVNYVNARDIVEAIHTCQRDSGMPYVCFKDHINRMSSQQNIGTIKSSNLCTEIMEYSGVDTYACCTLASINLKKFIVDGVFDHAALHEIVRSVSRNLDNIIDVNDYPLDKCTKNSKMYRPIGIGIQGLADVFNILRIPYDSPEAETLDVQIMETIYHAAISESCALAKERGAYEGFAGSPASMGALHPDLWAANNARIKNDLAGYQIYSGRYNFDDLRWEVMNHGQRGSHNIAAMPTVSTSQILNNNESFEPFHSNIYMKTTNAGKFTIVNKYMVQHLTELGLWGNEMKNAIISNNGSLVGIESIPQNVRDIYKTVWEIKQTTLMRRAALRGAFVDQSQSLNIYMAKNTVEASRGIFYGGWKLGLKTGSYYMRFRAAGEALKNNSAAAYQAKATGECTMCSA